MTAITQPRSSGFISGNAAAVQVGARPAVTLELTNKRIAPADLSIFGNLGFGKILSPGEVLYREGEIPAAIYQIVSGIIKVSWTSAAGREVIEEILLPGDILDLPSCLDGRPYPMTARAISGAPVRLVGLSLAQLQSESEILLNCQRRLWQQMRQQRSHRVATATERVERRLVRALMFLAERYDPTSLICPTGEPQFLLHLSRQELADWVGTTIETTIRTLGQFKRKGWVTEERGTITLHRVSEMMENEAA